MVNFNSLKNIYNYHIDLILADDGLTTNCKLYYGISKKDICPNCIFDSNTKKSANKYKTGGPIVFNDGRVCPYCNGIGYYGETIVEEDIYLAVIWDHKSWINFPGNVQTIDGYIQTISSAQLLSKIESANYMSVNGTSYQLNGKPDFAGLGDSRYIICTWKKINAIQN